MEEEFELVRELQDILRKKMLEKLNKQENFEEYISNIKRGEVLKEALYLLVENENFEKAVVVRDEMIKRGLDTQEKSTFEEIQDKVNNWLTGQ